MQYNEVAKTGSFSYNKETNIEKVMRKKSTYGDALRELVGGANKRLAIWNGLSSFRPNPQASRLGRPPRVIGAP
ncbi:hypothetical protein M493_04152 [Geobacillus genomosp. 3]|uniref:Uncharacterized protein n=1 Tax=Geobacillus genomosp. 3 TaxID=1921421 RepID=V5LVQ4_GEOG3|nr:hypothetical protein M493_04152 [Geobacillus genomosp. 3]